MPDPRSALVPIPVQLRVAEIRTDPPLPLVGCGLGLAGVVAIAALFAGLPLLSIGMFTAGGAAALVMASVRRLRAEEDLAAAADEINSHVVRDAYGEILLALVDVRRALEGSTRLRGSVAPVLARCRAAVALCGRLARLANPLQRHLDTHDPALLRSDLERLRAHAEAATDEQAAAAWRQAAAARARQLATHEQMRAMIDRILARLAMVRAALESFAATIVRLQVVDEEQLALAGASVAEHLDDVEGELGALESALAPELAA